MKLDELSYFNQQLAGMLKSGIPLEGALRQLCDTMRGGALQTELRALEADLAGGAPLSQALAGRRLPEFYKQMLLVGVEGNDLPGVLTLLADHYQRLHFTWTRLQGLLFYPLLVLLVSLGVSILVATLFTHFATDHATTLAEFSPASGGVGKPEVVAGLWFPVGLLGLLSLAVIAALVVPGWRRRLRWRLPGFQEAGLSHFASSVALLLQNGCDLNRTLALLERLEWRSPMKPELARWQSRLASGQTKFSDLTAGGKVFPPLFVWLVAAAGEDLVGGFRQAAQVYYERATHRAETLLYAALPVSVLALAFLILGQITPMMRLFVGLMRGLGDAGGGFGE